MKKNVTKRVAKLALGITKTNLNSLCCFGLFQPKLPGIAEKFKFDKWQ